MNRLMVGLAAGACAAGCVAICTSEEPLVVQDRPGYNCWPMIRTLGDKLVCAYSVGVRHCIGDGEFGVYARTSSDGGRSWSPEVKILNDPAVGEQAEGSGHDASGAMLLWVRTCGDNAHHDLYRTTDGVRYERISAPKLDPLPTQVMDVVRVPGVGLVSLWFYCTYGGNNRGNAWGMLVSADEGRSWTQRTVESGLPLPDAATEPSFVVLPDGRLFGIARGERSGCQFQIVSLDSGRTWMRTRTNITDVHASTPSLVYDPKTDLVANYYYERGKGFLKRRVARVSEVFDRPLAWPEPEILAEGSAIPPDAGNANAVRLGGTDYVAYYSGVSPNTAVLVVPAKVP